MHDHDQAQAYPKSEEIRTPILSRDLQPRRGDQPGTAVHIVLDNVLSCKSAEVHEWLNDNSD